MTPVAFLAAFCTLMAVVGLLRLARNDERTLLDLGTATFVVGTAVLAFAWAALDGGWLATLPFLVVLTVGGAVTAVGFGLLCFYWEPLQRRRHRAGRSSEGGESEDATESG